MPRIDGSASGCSGRVAGVVGLALLGDHGVDRG
jgi:hypothetical protein